MPPADTSPTPCSPAHGHIHGFTLIEALVVMLIIAVLATFAWPAYQAHVLRSRRADAQLALMQLQQHQARWRAEHPTYATGADLDAPASSPNGHYHVSVRAPGPAGYQLRAEAQGGQRADTRCAVLELRLEHTHTHTSSRTATGAENPDADNRRCWSR